MNHQPFENWLLDDNSLMPEQQHDLRKHLSNCSECTSLAQASFRLRSAVSLSPAIGFTQRFQARLAVQQKLQFRKALFGIFLLAFLGISGVTWLLFPYLNYLILSPAQFAGFWVSNLIYFGLLFRALLVLGGSIFSVLASLIPPFVWLLSMILLFGFGILWTATFRRIGNIVFSAA